VYWECTGEYRRVQESTGEYRRRPFVGSLGERSPTPVHTYHRGGGGGQGNTDVHSMSRSERSLSRGKHSLSKG